MIVLAGGAAGGSGFVLGVTAGDLSDAFLLAAAGALAVTAVGALVGGIKWLIHMDGRMESLTGLVQGGISDLQAKHDALAGRMDEGFKDAAGELAEHREELGLDLKEISLRVASVEHEFLPNDGASMKDRVERIDRRTRRRAVQLGALDDEDS